ATKKHKRRTHVAPFVLFCAFLWLNLLTLAVAAVPAEIAAARVLELAVAFGADADHVGHDGARDGLLLWVKLGLLFADRAGGVRKILDAPHGDHDALGDRLLR